MRRASVTRGPSPPAGCARRPPPAASPGKQQRGIGIESHRGVVDHTEKVVGVGAVCLLAVELARAVVCVCPCFEGADVLGYSECCLIRLILDTSSSIFYVAIGLWKIYLLHSGCMVYSGTPRLLLDLRRPSFTLRPSYSHDDEALTPLS